MKYFVIFLLLAGFVFSIAYAQYQGDVEFYHLPVKTDSKQYSILSQSTVNKFIDVSYDNQAGSLIFSMMESADVIDSATITMNFHTFSELIASEDMQDPNKMLVLINGAEQPYKTVKDDNVVSWIFHIPSNSNEIELISSSERFGVGAYQLENIPNNFPKTYSPLKQEHVGIANDKIQCRENLVLIQKYDGSPACVKPETEITLIEREWTDEDINNMLSSKYTGISDVEKLLVENKIDYLQDKLVVTSGVHLRGDPVCGAVVDTDSMTHWFGIDSISNPTKMTLYSENPQQCKVNTISCFCNAQMEIESLTMDELNYFTPDEQEKYSKILIDHLHDENINRTPKFQIGKLNINYTDSSAIGYCGEIWGTNTYGFFDGAIIDDIVMDYGISKELPLLCAISDDAKWWERK